MSLTKLLAKPSCAGSKLALIVGEDELKSGEVTYKPMRRAEEQRRVPRAGLAALLRQP
jgi:histidyl-tRNA synthetase